MTARPGKIQPVFNAGEVGTLFNQRTESKYYNAGLAYAENIELLPQGGFTLAPGLRHIGDAAATAARLVPFQSLSGNVYDLAFTASQIEVWGESAKLHTFGHAYNAVQVSEFLYVQNLDTLLTFHEDVAPWRALHGGPATWVIGSFPLNDLPTYDYGGPIGGGVYTNGLASEWQLDFIGFNVGTPTCDNIVFAVTVNGQETVGIYAISTAPPGGTVPSMPPIAAAIQAAVLNLPNVGAGVTCVSVVNGPTFFRVKLVFGGTGNLGDHWAVSARVLNKTDAAVLSNKTVVGVDPGEAIISADRGWPRCGTFYQQRLLLGGLKSLPNSWMASQSGRFSDFDQRLNTADGSFVAPLEVPGGEKIENIVDNRFLLVMTSRQNYWVAGSATGLSKTVPPKHVPASEHGAAAHVPVVANEGAALLIHSSGDFLIEMRYTDIDGNYATQDLSLLAYHMIDKAKDLAIKRKAEKQSSNTAAILNADGSLRLVYLLREQELTGFVRYKTDGSFKAVAVNGRNEMTVIAERKRAGDGLHRSLERFEAGLLLHGAVSFSFSSPVTTVAGLGVFQDQDVWAIGDGNVFGPFCACTGMIELPVPCCEVTVGRWTPPRITTLPLSRMIGPNIWLQKRARIHSVQIRVEDTTSLAVEVAGVARDIPLQRYGAAFDIAELDAGVTGVIPVRGLTGYGDDPQFTLTQTRPGRLTVTSLVLEASL
jgi:hypothetical protein